jgi:hypothetical protein
MRKKTMFTVALAGWLVAASAYAHEGGSHSRGTVKEITDDRIVLSTTQGASVTVAIAPDTRFVRGHRTIRAADVRPGERVVVHAANHDGKLEATEVMVAETAK